MNFDQKWFNRSKTDYETPDYIFNPLNEEFQFTLDVCADANNKKVHTFFSIEQNALTKKWTGVCWMNPPFGRELKRWVQKAYLSSKEGATVVALLPARTNTHWWHDYCLGSEIRFIKGQVIFNGHTRGLWMPFAIVIFKGEA